MPPLPGYRRGQRPGSYLALLIGLVNVPAAVLLTWLIVIGSAGTAPLAAPLAGAALVALSAGLVASLLLYRHIARTTGRLAAALAANTDHREQLRAVREAAAEAASQAKSGFLVHMSHEVRTPLNGILGVAQVLAGSHLDDQQRGLLHALQQSAEALLAMLQQVLEFARLESGQLPLARRCFSPRRLVREALAPLAPLAHAKGLALRQDIGDVPDAVIGDPTRLRQILGHLLGNAIKFTEQGEVVVGVRMADGRLHFSVADTGIGIPADKLARIFEPFEQADPSSTRDHGGAGLGLAIASRLVEKMGGTLEVESVPGRGSTFRFRVPLAVAPSPDAGTPEASRGVGLVVLADEQRRADVQESLHRCGWDSVGAGTGREALAELLEAVVQGTPFALLVLEERLPDVSALEVLEQLASRCEQPHPTVLLCDDPARVSAPPGVAVVPRAPAASELHEALQRLRVAEVPLATG